MIDKNKIPGHHYFDPTRQPKSGYAVPEPKHSKIETEKTRKDFLEQWKDCSKGES
jgi:hypothetical protein